MENTGRYLVKDYFFIFYVKSMTGIRSTLEPGDEVIIFGKKIDNFPFSFIAPLEAEYYIYRRF